MIYKINQKKGISLVEVVIGSAIALIVILATVETYSTYINYSLSNQNNTRANFILEEGIESILLMRDQSWSANIATLSSGSTYYLYFNGSAWTSTTTEQYVDTSFLRSFIVSNVNRDSNDDISSMGTNDPDTKKITVSVEYLHGHSTTTKSISTYITNLYVN